MLAAVPFARFVAAYFACHYIGAVACPVDKNAVKDTLLWMRDFLETEAVFYEGPLTKETGATDLADLLKPCGNVPEAPAKLDGEVLADIIFTSATTGKPKGVMLTHRNIIAGAMNRIAGMDITAQSVYLAVGTLAGLMALGDSTTILYADGTIVLCKNFSLLKNTYTAITENNVTILTGTPVFMDSLCRLKAWQVFLNIKTIVLTGASIPATLTKQLTENLTETTVYIRYGSTEAMAHTFCNCRDKNYKAGCVGIPSRIQQVKNRIIDDDGVETGVNTAGRVAVWGDMVMKGYWHNSTATQSALVDGWFITSDVGYLDDKGYLFLLGRADDIINIDGKKISPLEIEECAKGISGVMECCCVAVEDPLGVCGQVPILYVAMKEDAVFSKQGIRKYLAAHLDRHKLPYTVVCVSSIPKNERGKFLRCELVTQWKTSTKQSFKQLEASV
jgi:long-chain acyl-CoA synthetase